jgi:purine-binding chemotaxis protein CheW
MKTPESYFRDQVRLPDEAGRGGEMTPAEQAFLDKYVGLDQAEVLSRTRRVDPRPEDVPLRGLGPRAGLPEDQNLDESLRGQAEIQFVSFKVGEREFALPIAAVQEVLKHIPPTKLPKAPQFVSGIINLRGRVTPLIRLGAILGREPGPPERFIVVCRQRGLQVGLEIGSAASMHRAANTDIDWVMESKVGVAAEYVLGLMRSGQKLVSILSIDRLVRRVLRSEGEGHG